MRKVFMSIIVGLLLIWTIYFMVKGSEAIGVKGFLGLKEENEMLEKRISTLNKTINNSFSGALVTLDSAKDNLIDTKTEYENQAALTSLNNTSYTAEKFDIELLWTRLGNFAKDENVRIKMDVVQNTDTDIGKDLYDLDFTVSGTYDGITNFIYDIEKNETLGFKIDNFQMTGAGEMIEASFECREISVNFGKQLEKTTDTNTQTQTNADVQTQPQTTVTDTDETTSTETKKEDKKETPKAQVVEKETSTDNPSSLLDEFGS